MLLIVGLLWPEGDVDMYALVYDRRVGTDNLHVRAYYDELEDAKTQATHELENVGTPGEGIVGIEDEDGKLVWEPNGAN